MQKILFRIRIKEDAEGFLSKSYRNEILNVIRITNNGDLYMTDKDSLWGIVKKDCIKIGISNKPSWF